MSDIYIRALTPDDWEIFRALRIRAITLHTNYFLQHPDKAKELPVTHWQETLDGKGKQVFGLFDGQVLIGITAVFTWRADPKGATGFMAMSFIEPEYRGRGYSDLLYKARIDFAVKHHAWDRLIIGHRAGNKPSEAAIKKHGFKFVRTDEIEWPDGTKDTEYNYEMDLHAQRKEKGV